ncbi:MAG: ABC transporter permease subunit [Pseudonocardiaceae bacterium]|nr:ABC transporter permease subunit [Pseudonocardiaceae bacterium]
MTGYVLRRLLSLVPTWLGISLLAFLLATLSPGDPAQLILNAQLDQPPTPVQIEAFREANGLDDPFLVQYGSFVAGLLRGDFGTSFRTGEPVLGELAARFPSTLQITVPAFALALLLAILIGVLSALRRNSLADHTSRVAALVSDSVPSFVLAYLLIIVFSVQLGLLPVAGKGGWDHLVLPVLTLALATTASLIRLTRSSFLEVLGEDYVRTARAMGLHWRTIVFRNALKNALIPVVTVAALLFAGFVTGTAIVETVFAWPGVGKFVVDSIFARDYAVIQGFVVFAGTVFVVVNLLVDLLYVRLDPRVRLSATGGHRGR